MLNALHAHSQHKLQFTKRSPLILFIPVIVGVLVRTVAVVAVVALLRDAPGHSLLLSAHRRKLPERIK